MQDSDIIAKGLEIYKRNKFKYQVVDYLKRSGLDEQQSSERLEQIINLYNQERKKHLKTRNTAIFAGLIVLFLLTIIIFYWVVPHTSMRNTPFFTAVLGAGLLMLILYFMIAFYNSWSEEYLELLLKNNSDISINYSFLFIMILPVLIPYFVLDARYKDEIETKIVDGWSEVMSRRGSSLERFYISLEFENENEKEIRLNKEVSRKEFDQFYKGKKVRIVYDKNAQQNIEILSNSDNIRKFTNSEERILSPDDLFYLLKVESNDSVLNYLNQTSFGWERRNGKYINDRRFEMIEKSEESIGYVSSQSFKEVQKTYKDLG